MDAENGRMDVELVLSFNYPEIKKTGSNESRCFLAILCHLVRHSTLPATAYRECNPLQFCGQFSPVSVVKLKSHLSDQPVGVS